MKFLLDTNVLSELRKGDRCNAHVTAWFAKQDDEALFLSVLVVGEIRLGIENIRERDQISARAIDRWLEGVIRDFGDRILPVDLDVAEAWGMLGAKDPLPPVDALLAATATVHGLTVVTRNEQDFKRTGAPWVNPFSHIG